MHDNIEIIDAVPVRHWGRIVSAVVVGIFALMIINVLITNPNWHWDVVWANLFRPEVIRAVGWTLALTVGAMVLGIILAVTMAVMRRSQNPVLRWVAMAYIWFFRGTPIYTQLIFWGLIGTLFTTITVGIPWTDINFFTLNPNRLVPGDLQRTMFIYAVLGLGLNEGAYLSEIVRSGLNSVDAGQEEAAKALGMSRGQVLRRIVFPQAMRVIIPPTGNETISMLKTTSLVSAVPFTLDLTYVTNALGFASLRQIPWLLIAVIWYLAITSILMVGQHYIEAYYGRGVKDGDVDRLSRRAKAKQRRSRQAAINAAGTTVDNPMIEYTP
ncbi:MULTISPECIES: amino acid ABC transporter permease [Trueperella]|uniref:Amino acid ABC transporter permease n=1 Tax=Trueperella bernardiae TaxID=59561 RepID=A0A0W1KIZ7_9ACTO|nr:MULTISPECIES: amino acid ABC transporter permease [Trueperella]KTF04011.1 Inner membrane amino-acid ABC transporter permease protein YecS [Trueperella bernardiae]MCM3907060.1 amino acid ABC transporter permease [Trueperella bernardiae]MDK8601561.1 amino acid ABC transporter permease [Trueperella bernardiae]OFS67209.1 ABC transporter permease [Trueperella sp. HMSC08H06]WIM08352.1 amino acid ABC transporter permease [Trueperella bernardiae]